MLIALIGLTLLAAGIWWLKHRAPRFVVVRARGRRTRGRRIHHME